MQLSILMENVFTDLRGFSNDAIRVRLRECQEWFSVMLFYVLAETGGLMNFIKTARLNDAINAEPSEEWKEFDFEFRKMGMIVHDLTDHDRDSHEAIQQMHVILMGNHRLSAIYARLYDVISSRLLSDHREWSQFIRRHFLGVVQDHTRDVVDKSSRPLAKRDRFSTITAGSKF